MSHLFNTTNHDAGNNHQLSNNCQAFYDEEASKYLRRMNEINRRELIILNLYNAGVPITNENLRARRIPLLGETEWESIIAVVDFYHLLPPGIARENFARAVAATRSRGERVFIPVMHHVFRY